MEKNSNTDTVPNSGVASGADGSAGRVHSRRQFIKGTSLALPAVMTLHSGAAQAMVSITCGAKALTSGKTATCLITGSDGCLRSPVTLCDTRVYNTTTKSWTGDGIPAYFLGKKSSSGSGLVDCWRKLDGSEVSDESKINKTGNCGTRKAIIHISATDGSTLAIGANSPPPNGIITSAAGLCMASLAARSPV